MTRPCLRRYFVGALVLLTLAGCIPPTFTYASPQIARVGTALQIVPKYTGPKLEAHFTVAPALPSGLTLNAKTGTIGGTPTSAAPETTYAVTASAALGSTTVKLVLTVLPLAPANLSYVSPQDLRVGEGRGGPAKRDSFRGADKWSSAG